MVTTAIAAEVTGAVRGLGSDMESQGRALGARLAQEISYPSARLVGAVASALGRRLPSPDGQAPRPEGDVVIVDRFLTRC
jgi:hypothetical protein